MKVFALIVISMVASMAFAQPINDNAQLTSLFTTDQAARHDKNIDWAKLNLEDQQRRVQLRRMLKDGQVRTANDYFHASLILQHGRQPDDYLLAHVLAVNAVSLGNRDARWLAAATLDRYLRSLSQPQIYGTQFKSTAAQSGSWTQQDMNPSLLSDSLRAASCVVPLAQQRTIIDEANHGGELRSTSIDDCK